MRCIGRTSPTERASTTVEFTALAAAVGVLVGAAALGLSDNGGALGTRVGQRIEQVVRATNGIPDQPTSSPVRRAAAGRTQGVREWRTERGDLPARVPRDDLRLPVTPPTALTAWHERFVTEATVAGARVQLDGQACLACVALGWNRSAQSGLQAERGEGAHTGVQLHAQADGRIAAASADLHASAVRAIGPATADADLRLRGTLGAEADAEATLQVGRTVQQLELRGGAMAGAVGRTEGSVGVELLGIALRQSGRAEGWAGAGARGVAKLQREGSTFEWTFGAGAAIGLGGSAEWSGSIDVSGFTTEHRRLARDSLAAGLRAAGLAATIVRTPFD